MSTSTLKEKKSLKERDAALTSRGSWQLLKKLAHEPLLHFLLLGTLIFLASAILSKHKNDAARRIVIDDAQVAHFVMLYQAQMGSPPSQQQIEKMIEGYIREEVQFREAKRMGLDQGDEIVRRRLASKFDFIASDMTPIPEPSSEELRRYYQSHPQDFATPATVTLTHLYFSPDQDGDAAAHSRAQVALEKLRSGELKRSSELGDRFPLQTDYADLSRLDLVQQFGDSPLVQAALTGPVNQWSGPVRSGYGWHLIYVSHREPASTPPFQEIQDKVKTAFLDAAKVKASLEKYIALEKQYIIERTDSR